VSERKLLSVEDVLELHEPPWLVDRILPANALAMVWGPPNIGKSFLTLDLACSMAAGGHWLQHNIPEAQSVVYVAAEGAYSFKRRIGGWLRDRGCSVDDFEGRLQFLNGAVQLHEGVESFMRLIRPSEPKLIIFDTLAACSLGNDEDGVGERGPVMENLLKLRKQLKATVLVVHHTGWTEDHERGSSSMRGIMDTSLQISGEEDWKERPEKMRRYLTCSKQRDAAKFYPEIAFTLEDFCWMGRDTVYSTKVVTTPKAKGLR
jgi:RecA-family ATPase